MTMFDRLSRIFLLAGRGAATPFFGQLFADRGR